MVEELQKYQHFFKHIQLDTYWIVCLIHNNPSVECIVNRLERDFTWNIDHAGMTIRDVDKEIKEFFELLDGNGYQIEMEASPVGSGTYVKIKLEEDE